MQVIRINFTWNTGNKSTQGQKPASETDFLHCFSQMVYWYTANKIQNEIWVHHLCGKIGEMCQGSKGIYRGNSWNVAVNHMLEIQDYFTEKWISNVHFITLFSVGAVHRYILDVALFVHSIYSMHAYIHMKNCWLQRVHNLQVFQCAESD